ncbi:hypothetical protein [Xanthomonas phage X2]|nr:hypothetical protein [Xanthomonas phage X2]
MVSVESNQDRSSAFGVSELNLYLIYRLFKLTSVGYPTMMAHAHH